VDRNVQYIKAIWFTLGAVIVLTHFGEILASMTGVIVGTILAYLNGCT
jgi:hypothetical protein